MSSDCDWNDKQLAKLRALWAEGLSAAKIGAAMGLSKNAIVGKAHRLNLPPRPSPIRRGNAAPKPAQPLRAGERTLPPLKTSMGEAEARPAPVVIPKLLGRSIPCCWPSGTPGKPDFKFCDAPSSPGRPYCERHCGDAYVTHGNVERFVGSPR